MATLEEVKKDFPNSKRVSSTNNKAYYIQVKRWCPDTHRKRWQFVQDDRNSSYQDGKIRLTDETYDALTLSYYPNQMLDKLSSILVKLGQSEDARIVEVSTTVNTKVLTPDESILVERLRNSGLSKLNEREMVALGLQSLAVYDKCKFYGVDDVE